MTTITLPRATVEQALKALEGAAECVQQNYLPDKCGHDWDEQIIALRAALAQQAEPVAGKVVAWGVFANIDGEWQLQHPVFAGDEQGKVNAEFERASYSGPQPLEVRPLGVVTATAQQAEPVQDEPVHDRHGACPTHCCPIHGCKYMHDDCPVVSGAVKPVYPRNNGCESCAEDALAQEPVAYIHRQGNHWEVSERHLDSDEKSRGWTEEPLYTAPPQRKLVPLTEEEIYHATGNCGVSKYTAINIARAIEDASWEKNNGQA